jgi:hypothetical protein
MVMTLHEAAERGDVVEVRSLAASGAGGRGCSLKELKELQAERMASQLMETGEHEQATAVQIRVCSGPRFASPLLSVRAPYNGW